MTILEGRIELRGEAKGIEEEEKESEELGKSHAFFFVLKRVLKKFWKANVLL